MICPKAKSGECISIECNHGKPHEKLAFDKNGELGCDFTNNRINCPACIEEKEGVEEE